MQDDKAECNRYGHGQGRETASDEVDEAYVCSWPAKSAAICHLASTLAPTAINLASALSSAVATTICQLASSLDVASLPAARPAAIHG